MNFREWNIFAQKVTLCLKSVCAMVPKWIRHATVYSTIEFERIPNRRRRCTDCKWIKLSFYNAQEQIKCTQIFHFFFFVRQKRKARDASITTDSISHCIHLLCAAQLFRKQLNNLLSSSETFPPESLHLAVKTLQQQQPHRVCCRRRKFIARPKENEKKKYEPK